MNADLEQCLPCASVAVDDILPRPIGKIDHGLGPEIRQDTVHTYLQIQACSQACIL